MRAFAETGSSHERIAITTADEADNRILERAVTAKAPAASEFRRQSRATDTLTPSL